MTRSPVAPVRAAALAGALSLVVLGLGCQTETRNSACVNHRFDLERSNTYPVISYMLAPKTIQYSYREVHAPADTLMYAWDTAQSYAGFACLRFQTTDRARIDSSGNFEFWMSGDNGAYMRRHMVSGGVVTDDSIIGYIFQGCEGDGGTYRLYADSSIALTWANGEQHWIFNPVATRKLVGDTVWMSIAQSTNADSIRSSMSIGWGRNLCGL